MSKKLKITLIVVAAVVAVLCIALGGYFVIRNMMQNKIDYPFESNGTEHKVSFDSMGGSDVASQTVRDGNPVLRPETPVKEGYYLLGWFTEKELTNEWIFDKDRVHRDMTLYAAWQKQEEVIPPTASLTYVLNEGGNGYTVTGVGEETVVVIPAEYNGLPVTEIQGQYGTGAFARKAITSVTLPDSIQKIGSNTFYNCSSLVTVNIGQNSKLTTIGNNAFSGCGMLREMYIPANMTQLGDNVFNNCASINFTVAVENTAYRSENGHLIECATQTLIRGGQSEVIPEGVISIAQAAFRRSTLSTISIPSSVVSIGNYIIADSSISKIDFGGTEEQWNAIEKGKLWNLGKTDIAVNFNVGNK